MPESSGRAQPGIQRALALVPERVGAVLWRPVYTHGQGEQEVSQAPCVS